MTKFKKILLFSTMSLTGLSAIISPLTQLTNQNPKLSDPVSDQSDALNAWTKSINNAITVDMSGAQSTSDFATLFQASFSYSITNFLQSPQGALWASEFSNDLNSVSAVSVYNLPTTDGTISWLVNITLSMSNGTKVSVARQLMMNVTFLNLPTDTPSDLVPGPGVINPSNPALDQLIANYSYYTRYLQIQVDLSQYTSMAQAASAMQTIVANGLAKYATFWHISGFNLDPTTMRITLDTPIPSNHEGETFLDMSFELQLANGQYVSVGAVGQIGFQLANTPIDPSGLTPASTISPARQAQINALNALQTTDNAKYEFITSMMPIFSKLQDDVVASFKTTGNDSQMLQIMENEISGSFNFSADSWPLNTYDAHSNQSPGYISNIFDWKQNSSGHLHMATNGIGMELNNMYFAQENFDLFALFTSYLPYDLVFDGSTQHVANALEFDSTVMNQFIYNEQLNNIGQVVSNNIAGQDTYDPVENDNHLLSLGQVYVTINNEVTKTKVNNGLLDWYKDSNTFLDNYLAKTNRTINLEITDQWNIGDVNKDFARTGQVNPFANSASPRKYLVEASTNAGNLTFKIADDCWKGTNVALDGTTRIGMYPDYEMFQTFDEAQLQFYPGSLNLNVSI